MKDLLLVSAVFFVGWALEEHLVTGEDSDAEAFELFGISAHQFFFKYNRYQRVEALPSSQQ